MSLQEKIRKRQNEKAMLKYQFAARKCFNLAETFGNIAFVVSLISVVLILLPEISDESISLFLPIVLDLVALGSYTAMGHCVSVGADIRNYFDQFVLDIDGGRYSREDKIKLENKVDRVTQIFKRECAEQIVNTGHDNPPGVKDWYEFPKQYKDSDVVFECQKINARWDKELTQKRLILQVSILFLIAILSLLVCVLCGVTVPKIIACVFSAALTLFDRAKENIKYIRQSDKIHNWIESLGISKSKSQVKGLQELIEEKRKMRVVGINLLHKKNSHKMSEQDVRVR